jgi:hypothetical protein
MARLLILLTIVLAVVTLFSVSADIVIYVATFVPCVPGATCPQGNPATFNKTFALNGTISLNLTLHVGDRLQFNLATTVPIHPLAICRNSPVPKFCQGVTNSDELNTPITQAGTNTSVTFTTAGTYYYGCFNHPGMGGTINVVQTATVTSSSSSGLSTGTSLSSYKTNIIQTVTAAFIVLKWFGDWY